MEKEVNKGCRLKNNIVLMFVYLFWSLYSSYVRECSCFKELCSEDGKGIISAIDPQMVPKTVWESREEREESKHGKMLIFGIWEKEIRKFFALFIATFLLDIKSK